MREDCARSWKARTAEASENWASFHKLCRQLRNQPTPVIPLTHRDGTPKYRAVDRAEIFAKSLETQFKPNPDKDPEHTSQVEKEDEEATEIFFTLGKSSARYSGPSQERPLGMIA